MSSTKREGFWDNNITAPYTKPTFVKGVPGPGKYDHEKKKDRRQTFVEEKTSNYIPFSASSQRDCLKDNGKTGAPGPGQYIDVNKPQYSSVAKNLLKFSQDQMQAKAHGVQIESFGSKTEKFRDGGYFKPKLGPGPGDYSSEKNQDSNASLVVTIPA